MPTRTTVQKWFLRMQYELSLRLVSGGSGLTRELTSSQITRPGLALAGYFRHFIAERIQVFGQQEIAYLADLSSERRAHVLRELLAYPIPAIVVTTSQEAPAELVEESQRQATPVFSTRMETASFISRAILFLEEDFGASEIVHANLVEVYGVGVLIRGKSGIGKSECALELLKRGHRFVADDSVVLKHVTGHRIIGTAAHPLKHYMEVRGVGIIDVVTLFGVTSVRTHKRVAMVATLETWDEEQDYVRSGLVPEEFPILGEMLPHARVPVHPGRNPAILLEVATMDLLARRMGHFAAREFNEALLREMETGPQRTELDVDEWDDQFDF
jgi:HPr kinase/phosphorylase